jgi:hypothetical protein
MYSTMAPVTCHRTMTTTTTMTTRRATIARAGGASQGNDATRRDGDTRVFQKMHARSMICRSHVDDRSRAMMMMDGDGDDDRCGERGTRGMSCVCVCV